MNIAVQDEKVLKVYQPNQDEALGKDFSQNFQK